MAGIRYMKKNEADIISFIRKKYLGEFIEDRFKNYIKKNPGTVVVACEEEDKESILGYAFAYLWRENVGIIHHIIVPGDSNNIVEKELIDHLEKLFTKRELKKAYAWAKEEQVNLIKYLYDLDYNLDCEMLVFNRDNMESNSKTPEGNKEIVIENFKEKYLEDMLRIEEKCFKPSWHQKKDDFLRYAKRSNTGFLVALDSNSSVGYLHVAASKDLGHLGRVAVLPEYQRQGIGTRFTKEAMTWFEKKGVKRIKLRSPQTDIPAHNLYKKFGFTEVGREYEFVKLF
jgi:ribosomal-protein-alanine N-acetyltransferase